MNSEDYKKAASYWETIEAEQKQMPYKALKQRIDAFITSKDTCALATGGGPTLRCTPIEYRYWDDAFYLFTEGGKKFYGLAESDQVALAIFDEFSGFSSLQSVQVTGTVSIIPLYSEEYMQIAKKRGLQVDALQNRNHVLHLLKITPQTFDFLDSSLKELGYPIRQHIIVPR